MILLTLTQRLHDVECRSDIDRHPYSHIITHMKTTLELPDDLLLEAKAVAVRRRTTLKAMIEHALRREIQPNQDLSPEDTALFEVGPHGILSLKSRGKKVTSKTIYRMMEDEDN